MMDPYVEEVRAAAANIEHEWDQKAVEWPLTQESVVIEAGGFKGRWALQIAERYRPKLYVFEPQRWAANVCRAVLGDMAEVFQYGLGNANLIRPMEHEETDGCTFITTGPRAQFGELRAIDEVLEELGISHIDLMLVNIEGYEYTLLKYMIEKDILPKRLMVQFHTFADPEGLELAAIHGALAILGYTVVWTYGVVLTAWEYRGGVQ